MPRLFSEEELLNLFLFMSIAICGPFMRGLLQLQLVMWAAVSTSEWLEYILENNPDFPIICGLAPVVDSVKDSWISIIKIKNHLEVGAMLISCVGWMFGLNAPLLAVLFS